MVEAFKKMILAKYSIADFVFVSITRTPTASCFFSSKIIECTTEKGLTVRLPVALAQGKVEVTVLKYPPKGHPLMH